MKRKRTIALIILGVLLIGAVVLILLKGGFTSSETEKYYNENGKIISKTKAEQSQSLPTESDVTEDLTSRGFTQFPITYGTTVNGDILNNTSSSDESEEMHPVYDTYYISSSNQTWTISVVEDSVTAYPVEYNQNQKKTETIVSESDKVKAYDIETNTIFEVIPDDEVVRLVRIDRITPEALDNLTEEVLDEK